MGDVMTSDQRAQLAAIRSFDQLIGYLRDWMGWPIDGDDLEELTFEYTAEELGIDPKSAAAILSIKRLRPLSAAQPWGIFFVEFEPKRLPVLALRRILSRVALKKRASANRADQVAWAADDLLFISAHGADDDRQLTFAHFAPAQDGRDLPTLKVLGWDSRDTALHLDGVARELNQNLAWPDDETNIDGWRANWRGAFTLGHREVVTTSKDLAIRLAALARVIRDRIKAALAIETETGPLTKLMKAFRAALIHDLDGDGFADMYAQTIAYGLLSARITDPKRSTLDDFAAHMRTNPFLRELMQAFLEAGGRRGKAGEAGLDFDELGFSDVVGLLDRAKMDAVVRDFGDRNPEEDPVIHFYELFLKEYDAKKRMQRGVFYTPRPVVSYIVRSVDELLRSEFGLEDGLADTTSWGEMVKRHKDLTIPEGVSPEQDFVQILDPATGTGTFLVEVIDVIHKTLLAKWKAQGHDANQINVLWNAYVPKHLLTRLHGYELLMAPYAIAHLKMGLKLYETGYRFGSEERAHIYLTNALDPWLKQLPLIGLDALAHEAAAVNGIKRDKRFTIVIGNPPYSGHSVNASRDDNNQLTFIGQMIEDYKKDCPELFKPAQAKWLQDDYVKFIRFAEYALDGSPCRILAFITNHSYLNNPTFRGMRRHLSSTFQTSCFFDLHGNIKRVEGAEAVGKDENVFDIQQGVAIQVSHSTGCKNQTKQSYHSHIWGTRSSKYAALTRQSVLTTKFDALSPKQPLFLFVPRNEQFLLEYEQGFRITDVMSVDGDPAPGVVSTHDDFAFAFTKDAVFANVESLLATNTEVEARKIFRLCSQKQWSYQVAKRDLSKGDWRKKSLAILYRPFDVRFTINDSNVAVHRRERVLRHMEGLPNLAICTNRQVNGAFRHVFCSRHMVNDCALSTASKERTYILPLFLLPKAGSLDLDDGQRPNLSEIFLRAVSESFSLPRTGSFGMPKGIAPEDVFHYAYAVLHSPSYRSRYAEFLKSDFPRLPLTGHLEHFRKLALLGGKLTALHLLESPKLAQPITDFIGSRDPEVEKIAWSCNTVWINKAQTVGFRCVPEDVWNFHIGGYQVCEKWLKDRRGRTLSDEDIAHYQKIVVAIAETIRLMAEIDAVIEEHGGWPGAFVTGAAAEA